MHDISPQEARERLEQAQAAGDRRVADRRVHALATGAFGVGMGAYLALSRVAAGTPYETPVLIAYALGLVALASWQGRAARSWPRHARRASYLGLATTLALFLTAVMVFNYREAQSQIEGTAAGDGVLLLALAGALVAAPMVVAGLFIRRAPRP